MALFRDRFRIESARARWWGYRDGWYFITINTWGRMPWFGEIVNGRVVLSRIGYLVEREWRRTAMLRPNVRLDAFVVMPDHFHAIIRLVGCGLGDQRHWGRDVACNVSTDVDTSTQMSNISPTSHSLAAAIRSFKSAVARSVHTMGLNDFRWQERFHDRIIRDERELWAKRRYARLNPMENNRDVARNVSTRGWLQ